MAIDWNLAQRPGGFENALAQGLQFGSQMAARRQQEEQRNALSAYAIDPGNEKNFNALAQVAPEYAIQVRGQRDAAAREAQADQREQLPVMGRLLQQATPENWAQTVATAQQYGFDVSSVPQQFDPAWRDQTVAMVNAMQTPEGQQQLSTAGRQAIDMGYRQGTPEFTAAVTQLVTASLAQPYNGPSGERLLYTPTINAAQSQQAQGGGQAGVPSGSPLSQPPPQQAQQSPIFPAGEWQTYSRAIPAPALAAIVERDRPVILNSQGSQVQTDVINGQIAYRVNGVWYDNPEGQ